jgi:hypothetical protein
MEGGVGLAVDERPTAEEKEGKQKARDIISDSNEKYSDKDRPVVGGKG